MSIGPVRSWSFPGALVDALRDTRKAVAAVELPYESAGTARAKALVHTITEQLDQHLIPRVQEKSSPAIVVVAGSTGSGKSTLVNALLGEDLTAAGVLRPTTKVPHVFHHPADGDLLSSAIKRASVRPHEKIPRGLAIVDSPDLDSLVGENREIARELLDAADLWLFVTTAARYGDAVPWEALRLGAERGAAIAIVLSRVTADVAAHVRRDLVERLRAESLESLPLFVVPEQPEGLRELPPEVVEGLRHWLDSVAAESAGAIIDRTLHGATDALKDWLEQLAELMDDQAIEIKAARGAVRRAAALAEQEGGEFWFREVALGPMTTRWAVAAGPGGPLFKIRAGAWGNRKQAREHRDTALGLIREELMAAVEGHLAFAAAQASENMAAALGPDDADGVGAWMRGLRDPSESRDSRARHAHDAAVTWAEACGALASSVPRAAAAAELIGQEGLSTTFMSAALGIPQARQVLALLVGAGLQDLFDDARSQLTSARRYSINREAMDIIRPGDRPALAPDASAAIRLRRAELRGLL